MRPKAPPRLVVRTTITTFAVVAFVLSSVLVALGLNLRDYVRSSVVTKLAAGQRMLSALEQRRAKELDAQVATLAENPTLKAAIDTYRAELPAANPTSQRELLATIEGELKKIADRTLPDVLAVRSSTGELLATAGRRKTDWPERAGTGRTANQAEFVTLRSGVFRVASAPIALREDQLGRLELATALDEGYTRELSALSGASTVIASPQSIVASALPPHALAALTQERLAGVTDASTIRLGSEDYAIQLLFRAGDAAVFSLDSIDASTGPAMAHAGQSALMIALGAFGLAGLTSLWLARTLAKPIDTLSRSLSSMTRSKSFEAAVPLAGSSQEIDALTETFNTMMRSVVAAEAETQSAYVGAIRALAMALDARDPYTAGHSERVSAISVAVGRQMGLDAEQLEVLRLGALLHDIGKIGVSDHVLRKPGSLTPDEFELIKQHPGLGARILRSVPFLARHIPIVELHHERPDGKGYPHGLSADEIPQLARIAHVADAYDAMTSARAYRPARGSSDALAELWKCAGAQFDAEVVQALARALPHIGAPSAGPATDAEAAPGVAGVARRMSLVRGMDVRTNPLLLAMAVAGALASDAHAQSWGIIGAPAIEAVASVNTSSDAPDDPFVFLDLATTFPIGSRFGAVVRPYAHRLAGGEWEAEMYQLQLRYQSATRIPVRVDAGIITSPLGLGTLELRADLSPAIKTPFYYYMPLPAFEARYDGVQLMTGGYPLGAIVSVSGTKWDARAGVTDSSPAVYRDMFERGRPGGMRQFVAGGGVSPVTGLRIGAGVAQGAYRSKDPYLDAPNPSAPLPASVTVLNLEAEYAFGHTRLSGEWIRNRFESVPAPAIARGYFVQAVHAFGPRLFGTVRIVGASAPAFTGFGRTRRSMTTAEVSGGYRLGHGLTVRAGYYGSRHFNAPARDHSAVASLVWSRRWF